MELSEIQKQYGRILSSRGKTQAYIAKALGVSQPRISVIAKSEGWSGDRLPLFNRAELAENIEELIFRQEVSLLSGKEEDVTRALLNHSSLCRSLKDIEETITVTSIRNRIDAAVEMMQEMAADGEPPELLEKVQAYHDRKVKEL